VLNIVGARLEAGRRGTLFESGAAVLKLEFDRECDSRAARGEGAAITGISVLLAAPTALVALAVQADLPAARRDCAGTLVM